MLVQFSLPSPLATSHLTMRRKSTMGKRGGEGGTRGSTISFECWISALFAANNTVPTLGAAHYINLVSFWACLGKLGFGRFAWAICAMRDNVH